MNKLAFLEGYMSKEAADKKDRKIIDLSDALAEHEARGLTDEQSRMMDVLTRKHELRANAGVGGRMYAHSLWAGPVLGKAIAEAGAKKINKINELEEKLNYLRTTARFDPAGHVPGKVRGSI